MSKVSFRARALDSNRPLQLHFDHEIADLSDYASISRSVPLLPSGMEKDEETEHHLQEALYAQQQFKSTDLHTIPIPEIDENANKFKSLYHALSREGGNFRLPKHYIRVQAFALDPCGDQDTPDYDLDSEDEAWLSASKLDLPEIELERMLEQLERHSDHTVVSLREAKALLRQDDGLTTAVYDYWLSKRLKQGHRLSLAIKADRRDGASTNDPYVAFRRRTEKMQTRKHRKNDEASYEKMLKLRRHMERACSLIELLVQREEAKSALLDAELRLFQRRWAAADFDGAQLRVADAAAAAAAAARKPHIPQQQQQQQHQQHQQAQGHRNRHHLTGGQATKRARKQPPPLPAPAPPQQQQQLLDGHDWRQRQQQQQHCYYGGSGQDLLLSGDDSTGGGGRYVWCRRRLGAVYAPARPLLLSDNDHNDDADGDGGRDDARPRRQFSLVRLPCVSGGAAGEGAGVRRLAAYVGLRRGRGGRLLVDRLAPDASTEPRLPAGLHDYLACWNAREAPPSSSSSSSATAVATVCAHTGEPVEIDPLFEHRLPAYELCPLSDAASSAAAAASHSAGVTQ